MTDGDQSQEPRPQDEILAGKYVLGVLSDDARREIEARMASDRAFAKLVKRWKHDIAGLQAEDEDLRRTVTGQRSGPRPGLLSGRWAERLRFQTGSKPQGRPPGPAPTSNGRPGSATGKTPGQPDTQAGYAGVPHRGIPGSIPVGPHAGTQKPGRPGAAAGAASGRMGMRGGRLSPPRPHLIGTDLWRSAAFWRGMSAILIIILLGIAAIALPALVSLPRHLPVLAELNQPDSPLSLMAHYDAASGHLHVTPTASGLADASTLQVWVMPASGKPWSLGTLSGNGDLVIPSEDRRRIGEGVTLAITLEPIGGSPTGLPGGKVLASGSTR